MQKGVKAFAIGDEAKAASIVDNTIDNAFNFRMLCGFSAGEGNMRAFVEGRGFGQHFIDNGERQIFWSLARIAKTVNAIELASIGQMEGDGGNGHGPPMLSGSAFSYRAWRWMWAPWVFLGLLRPRFVF